MYFLDIYKKIKEKITKKKASRWTKKTFFFNRKLRKQNKKIIDGPR
jgi:hypothetical protein